METDWQLALRDIQREFPKARVISTEDSKLIKVLAKIAFWNPDFKKMAICLKHTIYLPPGWPNWSKSEAIYHERIHMRQFARYGTLPFLFRYFFCLPVLWTFRYKMELEAYAESMRYHHENGRVSEAYRDWLVETLSGPTYLFAATKKRAQADIDRIYRSL